jgi:hypothetical protein
MKIGVFGDSFATEVIDHRYMSDVTRNNESWVVNIRQKGYDITTFGEGATSTYFSYTKFIENYKDFDHIVFCYSSSQRIHNLPPEYRYLSNFLFQERNLPFSNAFNNLTQEQQDQVRRIFDVARFLQDDDFDKFVIQSVFENVNRLCKNNKIKLVNILPFYNDNHSYVDFTNRSGDCLYGLLRVSAKELPNLNGVDPRFNHLSMENNIVLSTIVLESRKNPYSNIVDLEKDSRFVFDTKISNRYMNLIRRHLNTKLN